MLNGDRGAGAAMAMRIVSAYATAMGASRLRSISGAHIDGCLFGGLAGLEFAERLVDGGAEVTVPSSLNVASLDLLHPELYKGDRATRDMAKRLMDAYEALGCTPTWTCAPYQLPSRPSFGEHVAWAESNAIVFANSVLGARTDRYGDFIDICAAITGRVPESGLHLTDSRRGQIVFDVSGLPSRLLAQDVLFPVLGFHLGSTSANLVPVVVGIDHASEDQLKALGAAAATAGSVGLFHVVGVTPEAEDLATALQHQAPVRSTVVDLVDLRRARDRLNRTESSDLGAVSVGTPHYSIDQLAELLRLFGGRGVHESVDFFASTSRTTLAEAVRQGIAEALEKAGVTFVVDTCTYVTPIMGDVRGTVLTDSAKWAYYAPGNLGVEVAFGSPADCVESAVAGRMRFESEAWDE